ncbi:MULTISPECIES: sugar transferase [unclassified Synechococcus]|uniref:sugar transferase n=1 Tax=unclassified Synechococcus TaxID=2626047 RepID=UPI0021A56132|nr:MULTISPECIES: sugar transferase [unclassified Synechococcus]MCT0214709.1 sugar transferase [Synechococcus sp. CS-1326]MCT0234043.1 sugar transferase [Synechococcus sp. CS-1327]
MHWLRHRRLLALAAGFDALGVSLLAVWIDKARNGQIEQQLGLLVLIVVIYWSLGWLFGSYTLLKAPRLRWIQLLIRVGLAGLATVMAGAVLGWLLQASPQVTLLHRGALIPLFVLAATWSAAVRIGLRRLSRTNGQGHWLILAHAEEAPLIRLEWGRRGVSDLPRILSLPASAPLEAGLTGQQSSPGGVAISPAVLGQANIQGGVETVVARGWAITTLAQLAEQELQRIPPRWVGDQWMLFSGRIEGSRVGFEQQLKRYADVLISLVLLVITAPLMALAALLIKLGDRGPILYRQRRTGRLGQSFDVIKLRTMVADAETEQAVWSEPNDQRITAVGAWLRRTRLDELPQLINVLRGEMSLIGPRPERPELEGELVRRIPNYRLRHWAMPGLSGWAQVNMPYTSTVEDAELKLSYDLFYLRNSSIWLDLLILFKTIKIVLKAAGR